jgi:hypothetical protein
VNEDQIEDPPEPHRPHVVGHVLAVGIESAAHGEHGRRPIDERESEVPLQVGRVVAPARSELEERPRESLRGLHEETAILFRLFGVVGRRRQEWTPLGQLVVELRRCDATGLLLR